MPEHIVATYIVGTDAEPDCLACHFSVERLVDQMHRNRFVFCAAHVETAIAHGKSLSIPALA